MDDGPGAQFTVWGCRGSHPTPGAATLGFGGETTCYELRLGAERLWVDAGTGLRRAAASWAAEGALGEPAILLSHLHLDHLFGLDALAAHLTPERPATLYWTGDPAIAEGALRRLYAPPYWPVALMDSGRFRFSALASGEWRRIGAFAVAPFPLNHPGGCAGFEIEAAGVRLVIAADHEHGDPAIDAEIARRARDADLLVYDAAYSEAEYAGRVGWGHSTREEGLRLARAARPGLALLSHHDPDADDATLRAEEVRLGVADGAVRLARDGMTVTLDRPSPERHATVTEDRYREGRGFRKILGVFGARRAADNGAVQKLSQSGRTPMKLEQSELPGGILKVELTGSLDIAGAGEVDMPLSLIGGQKKLVMVDLSGVDFMASIGIRTLVKTARALSARGGKLVVFGANEACRKVFAATGVEDIVPVLDDEAEALAALA